MADTGPGIASNDLQRVSCRADPCRSRSNGGIRLGLTTARRLVEAYGGSIEAESAGGPVFKRPRSALAPAGTVHYYSAVHTILLSPHVAPMLKSG